MEPQPKYREKVLIGLEIAPPSFDVRNKVMGPGGANLQYITNETGAIVTLRGKGSGYIEANGHESIEPLHICVEHSKYEILQAGRQLAFNLIETVQQEWSNIQQQQQQQQQQQNQQHQQQQPPQQQQAPQQVVVPPVSGQQAQSTQQPPDSQTPLPQHFPAHLHSQGGGGGGGGSPEILQAATNTPAALQLPIQLFQPPPSITLPPPPIQLSQPPLQVNVASGGSGGGGATGGAGGQQTGVATSSATATENPSTTTIVQAQQPAQDLPHQIQIQPQQLFVSGSGGVIQPATLIPQQQLQPSILHQPQIITQASYPIQYMQASNGQMVVAYPNIVRPVAAETTGTQHPQVMLLQYTPQRPIIQGRSPAAQTQSIPQIVQIVNPQTGQVQHVLQHIQPQIQMQQLSLAGGGSGVLGTGGQVLMPLNQASQEGQTQQQLVQTAGGQLQFATLPASHHQGMIITSHPHQVQVSQTNVQQQQAERPMQQVVSNQHQHQGSGGGQVMRPAQGVKRRYESAPPNQLPPTYQTIPPPQGVPPPQTMTLQTIRKGVGGDPGQRQQVLHLLQQISQQQQQPQQQIQTHHIQHQQQVSSQQQQQQVQAAQLQQQVQNQIQQQQSHQLQQQQVQAHQIQQQQIQDQVQQLSQQGGPSQPDPLQQAEEKPQVGQSDDPLKTDQQPKRGRPATISGDVRKVDDKGYNGAGVVGYQQPQSGGGQQGKPGGGQGQVYGQEYPGYPPPSYPPIYQQLPPPPAPPPFQPYNSWIMPQ